MTRQLIKAQIRMAKAMEAHREGGATAVEYGLLVALIAAAIVTTVGLLGKQINTMFDTVLTAIGG